MKLYTTITSERATKSQGGNTSIETLFYVGSRDHSVMIARVLLTKTKDGYGLNFTPIKENGASIHFTEKLIEQMTPTPKGEKQKTL